MLPSLTDAPHMSQTGTASLASVPEPRLVKAAHEFEAAMMKELLNPLQPGHDALAGDDDDSGSASALGSFASEALGKALSEGGGFGIANRIIHQLSGNHSGNASVPANQLAPATNSAHK